MSWSNSFVVLDKNIHDRKSFDCGEKELNDFIQTKASKHMEANLSRTMVLPSLKMLDDKCQICAFYSVAPSSIERNSLPDEIKKKLPGYPVPVFLLAQLAVHSDYKGMGLGKITLLNSLEYLWKVNFRLPSFAIVVDCLNKEAESFYTKYGFKVLQSSSLKTRMFISMKTIDQLANKLEWELTVS